MYIVAKNSIIVFHTHFVFEKSLIMFAIPHTTVNLETFVSWSSLEFHSHAILKWYFIEMCSRKTVFYWNLPGTSIHKSILCLMVYSVVILIIAQYWCPSLLDFSCIFNFKIFLISLNFSLKMWLAFFSKQWKLDNILLSYFVCRWESWYEFENS